MRPNASLRGNGARAPGGAVGSWRNDEAFYEGKLCGETWRLGGGQDVARAMASVPHSLAVPLVCARLVRSTTAGLGEVRKRPIVDHHPINAAPRPENSKKENMLSVSWSFAPQSRKKPMLYTRNSNNNKNP